MRLNLLYVHNEVIGYGRLGVQLEKALVRAGVEIFDDLPSPRQNHAFGTERNPRSAVCQHASWISTPGHCRGWWAGQTRSLLTMWESMHLPEPFRESLHEFETLVVPSLQNQELFGEFHDNVKYVPLGVDPEQWAFHEREAPGQYFNFLICGGGVRKGVDLAIRAFSAVFGSGYWPSDGPAPRLIIKSPRGADVDHPRIEVISGYLSNREEYELYSMSHVYVQPSRGEGFGLQPLQAICQGLPTIATDAHGHVAYSHLLTHRLGWDPVDTPTQSFHQGPAGSWWEPKFEDLCEALRDAYDQWAAHVDTARENAKQAALTLTWDDTARQYLDAIGREQLEKPDVLADTWEDPTIKRYRITVNRPHLFEVGGVKEWVYPGRDYFVPADVKRILFDAGYLNPECYDGIDYGIDEAKFTELGAVVDPSKTTCPMCEQVLNTANPTDDEILSDPMPAMCPSCGQLLDMSKAEPLRIP